MNTTPEPEPWPLDDAATIAELSEQLNRQELKESHLVLSISATGGDTPGDGINAITYAVEMSARKLKRLLAVELPPEATASAADNATTPEAKQAVKDAFLEFVAPYLASAEALCRAEVFINRKQTEIVLLRQAEPFQPAATSGSILEGGPGWSWVAEVVGNDIVVQGAKTTAFGGANDTGDNGKTACGFSTEGHPDLKACALPLGGYAGTPAEHAALDGTPLPHLKFGLTSTGADRPEGAHVEVTDPKTKAKITVPVVDLGPAKNTGHALDLTEAAARVFKSNATSNNFSMVLNYRIINGALGLPPGAITRVANIDASPAAVKTDANSAVYESVKRNANVLTSADIPGTDHGNLGCAWAVNEVVRQALGHPIGGELSTVGIHDALIAGKGKAIPRESATPGTIIIAPTQGDNHGHVGIVAQNQLIYSNQSATGLFVQNYNFETWDARYKVKKGLEVLFYDVVA